MRASLFFAAATLLVSQAAHADSYVFSFGTSTSAFSRSGILTTGTLQAPNEYTVAAVSGTVEIAPNPSAVNIDSILPPGTYPTLANGNSFPSNDNTLFVFNTSGTLTQNGLSFLLGDGSQVNLYNNGNGDGELLTLPSAGNVSESVPVMITAATPEPSSFALFGTGVVSWAALARRRMLMQQDRK